MGLYLGDNLLSSIGKSPAAYAKDNGFSGTDEEFYRALADMPECLDNAKAYTDQEIANATPGSNTKDSPTESDSLFLYDAADSNTPKKTLISKVVDLLKNTFYTKTESDTLLSNKAPAGYGLGGIGKRVTDMDNAKESGFYSALGASNLPPNVESVQYGSVLVLCSQENRVTQTYFQDVTGGTEAIAVRRLNGDGWSEWEFICPPMGMGTVYRTSERYNKNPIYKKLDTAGILWWSTDQTNWKREYERTGVSIMSSAISVDVAPADLVSYINNLPKLLTQNITINVTSGTVSEVVAVNYFYGPAILAIQAKNGASVTFAKGIMYSNSSNINYLNNIAFSGDGSKFGYGEYHIGISNSKSVIINGCEVSCGDDKRINGVLMNGISKALINTSSFTNCLRALLVYEEAACSVYNCSGSGNTIGTQVSRGGLVRLAGSTPDLLGGASNSKDGVIFKSNGTLL